MSKLLSDVLISAHPLTEFQASNTHRTRASLSIYEYPSLRCLVVCLVESIDEEVKLDECFHSFETILIYSEVS